MNVNNMTAKEFAEKYVGRKIKNLSVFAQSPLGIVSGYKTNDYNGVVYEPLSIDTGCSIKYLTNAIILRPIKSYFTFNVCDFNTERGFIFYDEKKEIINPYPHTCKICKSPSRKCGSLVLCSNTKCKSKRNLNIYLSNFPKQVKGSEENPIYVKCPKCKKIMGNINARAKNNGNKGSAECYAHGVFDFTFVKDNWYVYHSEYFASYRITKYVDYPNWWKDSHTYYFIVKE